MAPVLKHLQLLEINIISAQDLEPVSRKMKTYATAWVHRNRKLTSRVDSDGNTNPTWNDKFVFRVDEEFLRLDTSAVVIEIHSRSWFKDTIVGTVSVLVGNLFPPHTRPQPHHQNLHLGMRFVALQIRRQSGRPQGILNIGVALLDSSMRSMPLYNTIAASAVDYHDLMGEDDQQNEDAKKNFNPPAYRPICRSRSERSGMGFDSMSVAASSMIGVPHKRVGMRASSMVSGSEFSEPIFRLKSGPRASSMVSGSEFSEPIFRLKSGPKASSVISGAELRDQKIKGMKTGKASSIVSESVVSEQKTGMSTSINRISARKAGSEINASELREKPTKSALGLPPRSALGNGRLIFAPPPKPYSTYEDSEVGPSPSEVAAALVEKRYPLEESVLDGWSVDESVEGLRSKLDRWRTEVPTLYEKGFSSSMRSSTTQQTRRHGPAEKSTGLFSCLGNFYGYECQCICGQPRQKKRVRSRSSSSVGSRDGSTFL